MYRRNCGFTLIELLIVVAIVGIIAAIAYPNYRQYVLDAHRAEGLSGLLELAQFMERRYTERNAYNSDGAGGTLTAAEVTAELPFQKVPVSATGNDIWYDLAITTVAETSFTLRAAIHAGGGQADDTKCGNLAITHTGAKSCTGSTSNCISDCWQ